MSKPFSLIVASALLLALATPALFAETFVPGVANTKLDPELKGHVLIEELNCAACHLGSDSLTAQSKKAPRLADIGSRVNPAYIEAFIRAPHTIKPGTTMPDVLAQLGDDKNKAATAITHFLLSLKKNNFAPQAPDTVAAEQGKRLFHARGCAACHSPRDEKGVEQMPATSVPLGALDKKYSLKSLVNFLQQPHTSRPSGRMPDMHLQNEDINRIAHFLLQDTRVPGNLAFTLYRGPVYEGLTADKVKADRSGHVKDFALESIGTVQHHTAIKYDGWINIPDAGRYTFFIKANGATLTLDGKEVVKQEPSDRRGVKQFEGSADLAAGWRKIQFVYFHTGREAKFSFDMKGPKFERAPIPSSMLSISNEPIPAFEPLKIDPELAARGRDHFAKFGCANCHTDLQIPVKPASGFAKLAASKGCIGETPGSWPRFDLSTEQRSLIANALPSADKLKLTDKQLLEKSIATFNCTACHERAGLGKVAGDRNELFTGTQNELGDQGRIPPPLTFVGAKLKPEWMADVMLRGKRQRTYLDVSMPQFGDANVGHLVELFGKVDELETVPIPQLANITEAKTAGWEMMGTTGYGCIGCHDYNGQKAAGPGALDIVFATERLQKNWFHLYMRAPMRFHKTVIMPTYWPDGVAARPNILGGDAGQQIEAIWAYLEDGTRAKKPLGLSRQSNEVRVGDVAEICRGRGPVGYRGIGVGYPERLNLAFDSEEMALRQLWKGEFANVDLGSFHPRGTDAIMFPKGVPFERLKTLDDNWPYKGKTNYPFPQDHGYQFRGYHLDTLRRPTFYYLYGDIAVEDFFEDVRGKDGKAFFKRTLTFTTPGDQTMFYFRAAVGKEVAKQSDRTFKIGALELRITSDQKGIVRAGDPADVLIPLTLPKGRSTLTLEYQW
ncbi:MAG: cytochrome c [Planctomycetota bacterium]